MRFTTKQDIEAPIAEVFRIMTDFDVWERAMMRRGIEVARMDKLTTPAAGMRWASKFSFRGKPQAIEIEMTQMEAPGLLRFAGVAQSMEGLGSTELMALSSNRTRMHVVMDVTPRSMTARILMQSLRLARARLDRSFAQRVAHLAGDIENRYRKPKSI